VVGVVVEVVEVVEVGEEGEQEKEGGKEVSDKINTALQQTLQTAIQQALVKTHEENKKFQNELVARTQDYRTQLARHLEEEEKRLRQERKSMKSENDVIAMHKWEAHATGHDPFSAVEEVPSDLEDEFDLFFNQ